MHAIALAAALLTGPFDHGFESHTIRLIDVMHLNGSRYVVFWDEEVDPKTGEVELIDRGWCLLGKDSPRPFRTVAGCRYQFWKRDGSLVTVTAPIYTVTWAVEDYEARFVNGGGRHEPIGR